MSEKAPIESDNSTLEHGKAGFPSEISRGPEVEAIEALNAVKAGRGKEVDIAAQVLADNIDDVDSDSWTPEEDKKLMRRVDWRIIPILFVCATLSGIDKTAISAAAIYDLETDLNLVGQQYSWCGSAPYFGGLAFMGFHVYFLQKFPPVNYFAFNVAIWGVLEMCMAACTSFGGLFTCRFLLGGAEALLIPSITMLVAMWYKPEEQPQRNAIILNVIAPILNGLIAWAVSYSTGPFAAWRIIFLTLGAFTFLWSAVVFFFLPNTPLDTKWLSPREKYMLIQRKAADNTGMSSPSFKKAHIMEAILDVKTWLIWFAIVALQVPNGGLTTFNTLIVKGLGFNDVKTSLLAMPPGFMSTASGIGLSYLAATTRKWRSVYVSVATLLPLIGAIICYTLPRTNLGGQLFGLYILYTYWAPYVTLVSIYQANIAGHSKKLFLFAWYYVAWAAGNIIGPQTFLSYQAPEYTGGTVAMIVCYVVAIICMMAYGMLCHASNMKRKGEISENRGEGDWLDLTDKENPGFKYTT